MKAVIITQFGSPEVLQLQDRPEPTISNTQVLIKVMAAGLNRLDIYQRQGKYPPPQGVPPDIPGVEVAGLIQAKGSQVEQWQIGDKVCALLGGGGYAEYVGVEASHCLPIPLNFGYAEGASLPETIFTVWSNVFQIGRLAAGENFLVHGGNSGIGITAIQLAKALGAHVYATAGSKQKCNTCETMGASLCINYHENDFEQILKDVGVDVILDMIGGDYFEKNINLLNPGGRLVHINAMKGATVSLNILNMMRKRITVTGSTLRSREDSFKASLTRDVLKNVWPLVEAGKFKAVIDRTFPLEEAAQAHQYLESGVHKGKIILLNS